MKFFISAEIYKDADKSFNETRAEVERKLNSSLKGKSYGSCLEEIGIIPIVLPDKFLIGRNERKLFQRKFKSADYRLIIDYDKFRAADERTKELLLINNIVLAIKDLDRKAKGAFSGEELITDILEFFHTSEKELNLL